MNKTHNYRYPYSLFCMRNILNFEACDCKQTFEPKIYLWTVYLSNVKTMVLGYELGARNKKLVMCWVSMHRCRPWGILCWCPSNKYTGIKCNIVCLAYTLPFFQHILKWHLVQWPLQDRLEIDRCGCQTLVWYTARWCLVKYLVRFSWSLGSNKEVFVFNFDLQSKRI